MALTALTTKREAFFKNWEEAKAKYPDALILCRTGGTYYAFDQDAVDIVGILGMNAMISYCATREAACAEFPYRELDIYLPKMIRAGRRVAIL